LVLFPPCHPGGGGTNEGTGLPPVGRESFALFFLSRLPGRVCPGFRGAGPRQAYDGGRPTVVAGLRWWQAYGGGRPTAVAGLRRWQAHGGGRPTAVAGPRRWQAHGGVRSRVLAPATVRALSTAGAVGGGSRYWAGTSTGMRIAGLRRSVFSMYSWSPSRIWNVIHPLVDCPADR